MSLVMMFTLIYYIHLKGKKRKKVHCELFLQNYPKYFCRFWSSFRGHIAEYSGLDILLKGL
jgi:hypothetical protein